MLSLRTRYIIGLLVTLVAACLSINLLRVATDTISSVSGYAFIFPASLFIGSVRGDRKLMFIVVSLVVASIYGGLAMAYSLHFLDTAGYLTGDIAMTWLEMVRSTSQLYILPFYFACIRRRSSRGRQRAAIGSKTVLLPGGVAVGIAFLPGSVMDMVIRSKECRAAAYYYCSYVVHCACTLAPAAAVVWFGLISVDTILPYVTVCSVVTIAASFPLFFFKTLNTPIYSYRVSWSLVPTLAATFLLQAYGGVKLKRIGFIASLMRNLLWIAVVPQTMQSNANY